MSTVTGQFDCWCVSAAVCVAVESRCVINNFNINVKPWTEKQSLLSWTMSSWTHGDFTSSLLESISLWDEVMDRWQVSDRWVSLCGNRIIIREQLLVWQVQIDSLSESHGNVKQEEEHSSGLFRVTGEPDESLNYPAQGCGPGLLVLCFISQTLCSRS